MPDREAFIAAIAANPADDLPRLVFADWLDENGESERAEFIRTQIRWHHATEELEKEHLHRRAADLFREHWQRWLGPFLLALDPSAELPRRYEVKPTREFASVVCLRTTMARRSHPVVREVSVRRGLLTWMEIDVGGWGGGCSLAEAFRHEPTPGYLRCLNGLSSPVWARLTDPALRRVTSLSMDQEGAWEHPWPESTALFEDPHLAGVRSLNLFSNSDEDGNPTLLPSAWLEQFVRSSLAYRLNELSLAYVPAGGTVPLCRPGRLRLESLSLGGPLTGDDVRRLGASELSRTVKELSLWGRLENAAVAALARDEWPKLKGLDLSHNRLTAAVLPALASAPFMPRLEELELSGNPLFEATADLSGLRAIAEVVDPERFWHLALRDTGLSAVPDFLTERLGNAPWV